jgi:hypothetical protein
MFASRARSWLEWFCALALVCTCLTWVATAQGGAGDIPPKSLRTVQKKHGVTGMR